MLHAKQHNVICNAGKHLHLFANAGWKWLETENDFAKQNSRGTTSACPVNFV